MAKVLKIAAAATAIVALTVATGGAAAFGLAGALSTTIAGTAISAATLLTAATVVSGNACALIGSALA